VLLIGVSALQEAQYLEAVLTQAAADQHDTTTATSSSSSSSSANSSSQQSEAAVSISNSSSGSASEVLALEVVLLGVVPAFRRRGVASRLIKQVKTHARTRG
jgi:ribosomal protein S18 acetylase RimI-like enzyme